MLPLPTEAPGMTSAGIELVALLLKLMHNG